MREISVLGAGTMGTQIAIAAAGSGREVLLFSRRPAEDLLSNLKRTARMAARKSGWDPGLTTAVLNRIRPVQSLSLLRDSEIIIESVAEDLDLKRDLLLGLGQLCDASTLLVTNTSSLSIAALAKGLLHPERFCGLHFFNPVHEAQLIELAVGPETSSETEQRLMEFARELGKEHVRILDTPGFIVNRLLFGMINEAAIALGEGVASASEIDKAMRLGAQHPLGPLALADFVGLDVTLGILRSLEARWGDRYRPAELLISLVGKGALGRKSGEGFFEYAKPKHRAAA